MDLHSFKTLLKSTVGSVDVVMMWNPCRNDFVVSGLCPNFWDLKNVKKKNLSYHINAHLYIIKIFEIGDSGY